MRLKGWPSVHSVPDDFLEVLNTRNALRAVLKLADARHGKSELLLQDKWGEPLIALTLKWCTLFHAAPEANLKLVELKPKIVAEAKKQHQQATSDIVSEGDYSHGYGAWASGGYALRSFADFLDAVALSTVLDKETLGWHYTDNNTWHDIEKIRFYGVDYSLARAPLFSSSYSKHAAKKWSTLKEQIRYNSDLSLDSWIDWYEAVLLGEYIEPESIAKELGNEIAFHRGSMSAYYLSQIFASVNASPSRFDANDERENPQSAMESALDGLIPDFATSWSYKEEPKFKFDNKSLISWRYNEQEIAEATSAAKSALASLPELDNSLADLRSSLTGYLNSLEKDCTPAHLWLYAEAIERSIDDLSDMVSDPAKRSKFISISRTVLTVHHSSFPDLFSHSVPPPNVQNLYQASLSDSQKLLLHDLIDAFACNNDLFSRDVVELLQLVKTLIAPNRGNMSKTSATVTDLVAQKLADKMASSLLQKIWTWVQNRMYATLNTSVENSLRLAAVAAAYFFFDNFELIVEWYKEYSEFFDPNCFVELLEQVTESEPRNK
jgi:hypothetical protein